MTWKGFYTNAQLTAVANLIEQGDPVRTAALAALTAKAAAYLADKPAPTAAYSVPSVYTNAAGFEASVSAFTSDADAAEGLGLLYRLTGTDAYAAAVMAIINAYATVSKTCAPHEVLTPGSNPAAYVENDAPLSMAELGAGLILGADLIATYTPFTTAMRAAFSAWIINVYLPACLACYTSPAMGNNWADWGVWGQCLAYYYLGVAIPAAVVAQLKANIDSQIAVDGSMPQEDARVTNGGNNSIWYRYFALAPMTAAARLVVNTGGTDFFTYVNPAGGSINAALTSLAALTVSPPTGYILPATGGNGYYPYDLFEAMAAEYPFNDLYAAVASPHRPIQAIGHHHAWTYPTLTCVVGQ